MSDSTSFIKSEIRSRMRKKLSELDTSFVKKTSFLAETEMIQSRIFEEAKSIALYYSFQNEVETAFLFEESKKKGKRIAYPKILKSKNSMEFFWVDSLSEFIPSELGPLEPKEDSDLFIADLSSINLMIIPALAFDLKGWRVGRGKGFYDKTLKDFSGIRVGLAYSFQVMKTVPHETEMDEPVHWLATENGLTQIN